MKEPRPALGGRYSDIGSRISIGSFSVLAVMVLSVLGPNIALFLDHREHVGDRLSGGRVSYCPCGCALPRPALPRRETWPSRDSVSWTATST